MKLNRRNFLKGLLATAGAVALGGPQALVESVHGASDLTPQERDIAAEVMGLRQKQWTGWDLAFGNPKWTTLAQAFGWHGHYVENSFDLRDTLEAAFTEKGPSLVVIPIDYRENALLAKKIGDIICTI